MHKLDSLLILNAIAGLGQVRIRRLLDYFGSPEKILAARAEALSLQPFLPRRAVENIVHFPKDWFLQEEYELIKKHRIKIVTIEDHDYPENLREISDGPLVLYVKGTLKAEHKMALAIVGSRRASFYGTCFTEKFAGELAQLGLTVVSGMAQGIDAAAHRGALKVKAETIAVLGNGLCHVYPLANKKLFEQIPLSGAIVSEFPMSMPPRPGHFPRRNRIISGLALGVLVVEASQKSGALITSDFALEQGREVFAIPGKPDHPNSQGVNNLIKQGARLVTSVEDIIEELRPHLEGYLQSLSRVQTFKADLISPVGNSERGGQQEESFVKELSFEEKLIYQLLKGNTCHIDEIVHHSGLPVSTVMALLSRLEFKKIVKQFPGKFFATTMFAS